MPQEVPSDTLEWLRKAWDLQTWLNRRVIATFCYFITTYSFQIKQFVLLLFLLFSPALMRGRERILASWKKALRTIGLIKDKSCSVRFVLQHLGIWVKSLVGSSWALKFLCIFYSFSPLVLLFPLYAGDGISLLPFLPVLCWPGNLYSKGFGFLSRQGSLRKKPFYWAGKALTSFPVPLFLPKHNFLSEEHTTDCSHLWFY